MMPKTAAPPEHALVAARRVATRLATHLLMIAIAVSMLLPLVFMISTSLKTPEQVSVYPPQWIPRPFVWKNFVEAWQLKSIRRVTMGTWLLNTLKVASLDTMGSLFLCSLAAYAFARLRFPGKGIAFSALLATLMIPYTVRVVPLYALFRNLHWINTHLPLIVPPMMTNVFGIFLLRQFFMTLPVELDEAAWVDGASNFRVYSRILIPLSKPALATLGLFTFRTSWNAFLPPLIFINSPAKQLITVGITLFRYEFNVQWELLMAGSSIAVIPMLIIFILAQQYFVQGISLTGIKG
jgi:multiple sugar transport system permease protein